MKFHLVAYIIIGLLILSFALWGIQEYFGGGGTPAIANVGGAEITLSEFNNQFQQRKQAMQLTFKLSLIVSLYLQ